MQAYGLMPHERKWGQKWYREADFGQIQFAVNRATHQYKYEQDVADRLKVALDAARTDAARYNTLITSLGHRHTNSYDAYNCPVCRNNRQLTLNAENARAKAMDAEADYKVQKLKADKSQKEIPQPDWTAVPFRPFNPAGAAARPAVAVAPPAEPEAQPMNPSEPRPVESAAPPAPKEPLFFDPPSTTQPSSP